MKLNMLFIGMYILIILAYPFVFVYSKLRQFSKARIVSITGPVTPGR
jgi:hypothetical protein